MTVYKSSRILKESLPLLALCVLVEVMGGQLLNRQEETLILLPVLLVMIPVVNGVGGNIGSVLGARITSGLHLGTIEVNLRGKGLRDNITAALLTGIISYSFLSLFILLIVPYMGISLDPSSIIRFGAIMVGAGLLLSAAITVLCVVTALYSFKKGLDPDNIVTPVITTFGDVFGIFSLIAMLGVIGV